MAQKDVLEKKSVSPIKIFTAINNHDYENLQVFMNNTDWFSITPQLIIPRDKIRALVRLIVDEEVRLDVMRYLDKYALDYFKPAAEKLAPETAATPIYTDTELERQTMYLMDEFRKELRFQIDLIESTGKFTGEKYHLQDKKIKALEKQVNELQETNLQLKTRINRFEHPEKYGKFIPPELNNTQFRMIMEYLQSKRIVFPLFADGTFGRVIQCYRWQSSKALFGYYVEQLNVEFELNEAREQRNWQIFEPVFENYAEIVEEARKAVSKYRNNPKILLPAGADHIQEAIEEASKNNDHSK